MIHREIELYNHLARGRRLRSEAFLSAVAGLVRGVKGLRAALAAPKRAETC